MTIVAQSSVVDQSQANKLLDQFEQTLLSILKEAGGNVISTNLAATNGVNGHSLSDLSSLGTSSLDDDKAQQAPFRWTKEAIQIRQEIASLAGVDENKVHEMSSIFELGLDSIDVIKLSSRLSKKAIVTPVSAIIKAQTIANMSTNAFGESKRNQPVNTEKTVQEISRDLSTYLKANRKLPDDAETVLPATPLQQSMVNEMIKSDYGKYFTIEAFQINQGVDVSKLLLAVHLVILQSPILRTTFVEVDDPQSPVSYAQIVRSNIIDSIQLSEDESFEGSLDQFKTEAKALATSDQALCEVKFVSIGQTRYLFMAISHALYDGRSLRGIHQDIRRAYDGQLVPRPDSLPYLDLVFQSTTNDAKRFWRGSLSNLPPAGFPKKSLSDVPDLSTVHRVERNSRIVLKDVERFCRSSRVTLQTLGQTCWAIVLSHLMAQLDVVFGLVLSCRDSEEADEVMFPLMNTVAVRSILHGSVSEMLRYMQELNDNIRQYQHFSLGTAQAYGLASRDGESSTEDHTLFDTLFIYQGRRQPDDSELLYRSVYGSSDVEFPVCVEMELVDDSYLSWTTACKSIARTATETEEIINALDSVLQRIISSPESPIIESDIDGISVCDLPKFQKRESRRKNIQRDPPNINDEKWSEIELKLRQVLHDVSDVPLDGIRKDSTIFHLGLDSILVLKLPALLRQYGIKLSVSTILKQQTVRAIAQSVLRAAPDKSETLDVERTMSLAMSSIDVSSVASNLERKFGEVAYVMPATAGQQYMIRSWQSSQGALFYPIFEYTTSGSVNTARLIDAWKSLVQKEDILRTGFIEVGSNLVQIVLKSPLNETVFKSLAGSLTRKDASDLRLPPVALIVEDSEDSITNFRLQIHHALYDGISLPNIVDQLQSLYRGQSLPTQELSFKIFVAQSIAASKRLRSASSKSLTQSKWQSYIKIESLYPPRAKDSIMNANHNERIDVFHPALKVSSLKHTAQASGVSIDALLLAAISKIYAQRLDQGNAGSQEVVFGIYLANRAPFGEDLSQLAAPTLNLLPICVRDPLSPPLSDIAKDIQHDLHEISSAEMSCASLAQIYEWCGVRVNFFVNILKDGNEGAVASSSADGAMNGDDLIFKPAQELGKRAEAVDVHRNEDFRTDSRHDAYLVRFPDPSLSPTC